MDTCSVGPMRRMARYPAHEISHSEILCRHEKREPGPYAGVEWRVTKTVDSAYGQHKLSYTPEDVIFEPYATYLRKLIVPMVKLLEGRDFFFCECEKVFWVDWAKNSAAGGGTDRLNEI